MGTTEKKETFKITELRVRLTFTNEILGTSTADPEVYRDYIASNAPDDTDTSDEVDALPELDEEENNKTPVTVFPRQNGIPCFWDYQFKGFFKDTCGALRKVPSTRSSKIKAYKKEIDGLIFIKERAIPIRYDGEVGMCVRPLRASTAKGERIALAASESIPAGATVEFTIRVMLDPLVDAVKEWLDYGQFRGMGQWRNSGKGSFTWELLEETSVALGA